GSSRVFVNGDTAASLSGTLAYTTSATLSSHVGSYAVTPSGLSSNDYTITFNDGTLDITPAALSVTADAIPGTVAVDHFTKVYAQANPAFSVRYSGFVNGDTAASLKIGRASSREGTPSRHVGSYAVTPSGL